MTLPPVIFILKKKVIFILKDMLFTNYSLLPLPEIDARRSQISVYIATFLKTGLGN